jgi:hypothetical protein
VSLGKSLRQNLKRLACRTPVEHLIKRGVKEVKVVGLDHIVAMIEEAVHNSLRSKLMTMEREELAGATREEFLRLLQSHQTLQRSHSEALLAQQRAQDEVDQLRRQLGEQKQLLREKLQRAEEASHARYEGENAEIALKVDSLFAELADRPEFDLADLRDHVMQVVMDVIGNERKTAVEARELAHDREVELLERRIGKLKESLAHTENHLAKLASIDHVEAGISSIYRNVQGLDRHDRSFERKRELMSSIFESNLALQKGAKKVKS